MGALCKTCKELPCQCCPECLGTGRMTNCSRCAGSGRRLGGSEDITAVERKTPAPVTITRRGR